MDLPFKSRTKQLLCLRINQFIIHNISTTCEFSLRKWLEPEQYRIRYFVHFGQIFVLLSSSCTHATTEFFNRNSLDHLHRPIERELVQLVASPTSMGLFIALWAARSLNTNPGVPLFPKIRFSYCSQSAIAFFSSCKTKALVVAAIRR